ncbi:hypothetical protein [Planktotalea sp.]|uniref:hypothetical protein n=1 Tax=Planktotalea sp. TaxID=2029877 RepID=UPI0023B63E83
MRNLTWLLGGTVFLLASCETYEGGRRVSSDGFIKELPEGVLAIAAPYQDLAAVRIDPADGCYVYRHVGPVETTFIPLRSVRGRPICTQLPDADTEEAATG